MGQTSYVITQVMISHMITSGTWQTNWFRNTKQTQITSKQISLRSSGRCLTDDRTTRVTWRTGPDTAGCGHHLPVSQLFQLQMTTGIGFPIGMEFPLGTGMRLKLGNGKEWKSEREKWNGVVITCSNITFTIRHHCKATCPCIKQQRYFNSPYSRIIWASCRQTGDQFWILIK